MHSTVRLALVATLLLGGGLARAQEPAAVRAQTLLSGTRSGHEGDVGCADLSEPIARALIELGGQVRGESLDRAAVAFRLAERAGRCLESVPLTAAALNELGNVLNLRGDNDLALAAATESAQLYERLEDDAGLAQARNIVGNVHWGRGEMREAVVEYERALRLWTAAGDRASEARAFNNIGNVQRVLGQFDEARNNYSRALAIFQELDDRYRAAVVTENLGVVYFWRGEYSTAVEHNRSALTLARSVGNKQIEARGLDGLGNAYRALGAYQLALQSFEQALKLRIEVDEKPGIMETSHNIGLVHFSQGDYELAIDAYKQGLRLNRSQHDRSFEAEALRNIGAAAWKLGQRQRAAANFRESLAIARREGFRTHEGELLNDLGEMALADGRRAEAARLFDSALELRRTIGDQAGITESLTAVASAKLANRLYDAGLDAARQAIANATDHDQPELLWQAQTAAGLAYRRLHQLNEARRMFTAAVASIERLSEQTAGSQTLRQRFFEDKLSPYHELIALDIERHAFADALELAERSKARVLGQLLRGNRADLSAFLSVTEKQDRTRLGDALVSLDRQIETEQAKQNPDQKRLRALESARRDAREAVAAFDSTLAIRHPELATVRGNVPPLTLADANRLLTDPATAVVEYTAAERQLFAFVVTTDGTRVSVDATAIDVGFDEVASRAEKFREQVGARDLGVAESARALYSLLLGPLRSHLAGKTRLIVVPDRTLWNVPFQALLAPEGYLIESAAVSYTPSLTVLREIARLPKSTGKPTLFAMGKSVFEGGGSRSGLEPLPDAEDQVRQIRELYGTERSVAYLGGEATESRFKTTAARYTVLHLATHGVLDEASPLYSHLVLSADRNNDEDDGRLEAWELMRLKLAADVVVLAACETGRGRVAAGEGVVGTMWALLAAGARSMVVSQFRVESHSATALLVGFHRRLAAGRDSKADDLREAALELLHTPRYSHPYYWAGFVLVGASN